MKPQKQIEVIPALTDDPAVRAAADAINAIDQATYQTRIEERERDFTIATLRERIRDARSKPELSEVDITIDQHKLDVLLGRDFARELDDLRIRRQKAANELNAARADAQARLRPVLQRQYVALVQTMIDALDRAATANSELARLRAEWPIPTEPRVWPELLRAVSDQDLSRIGCWLAEAQQALKAAQQEQAA